MTPFLLFQYGLGFAGSLLVVGGVGLVLATVFFALVAPPRADAVDTVHATVTDKE